MTRAVFEVRVNRRVNARDEETCDRRDVVNRLAFRVAPLKSFDESLRDLFVVRNGEDHRDVDIDAAINGLFNRGQAFGGRGNLNHHVAAIQTLEQTLRLFNRALRFVGKARVDFETDVAVNT